jgi:arylsulfatase
MVTRNSILRFWGSILFTCFLFTGCTAPEKNLPNIVIILADDMGFSDLGCYGGEINTPHIDQLAREGLRFTSFYNAARCCPTRASLLTGLYPHQAGMGRMVSRKPAEAEPGPYQGYLNDRCITLAELLGTAGYRTLMSGKWHVGEEHPYWPMDRGFEDYYGLISGGSNYFDVRRPKAADVIIHFARGNEEYLPPAENWYMTDAITDEALRMLDRNSGKNHPVFLYLAYTAPHWPLHAWPEDIEKYRGKYLSGWDELRRQRYQRQMELGLFGESVPALSERDPLVPAWETLSAEKKDAMDLKMAVYAAQIECMDRGIGRVLQKLADQGKRENTVVLFLSDNGACAEGGIYGQDFWENGVPPGGKEGFHNYGLAWANASNTPFRKYKQYIHEGGITTPFIASWPAQLKKTGGVTDQPGHIIDIMATCCEISGATYPTDYQEKRILPSHGLSLVPILKGGFRQPHEFLYWEHIGSVGIRKENWKLVAARDEAWELFDLSIDRTERQNIIKNFQNIAGELHLDWMKWAKENAVKISEIHSNLPKIEQN